MRRWPILLILLVAVLLGVGVAVGDEFDTAEAVPSRVEPVGFGDVPTAGDRTATADSTTATAGLPLWGMEPVATFPSSFATLVGDVTGDGRDDAVGFEFGLFVIPGGDSGPGPKVEVVPRLSLEEGALADVNGDGVLDLIARKSFTIAVYPGGVAGSLGAEVEYEVGTVTDIEVLDVNGDGRDDVVYLPESGGMGFLVQSESGTLEAASYAQAPNPGRHEGLAAGDFDGDGLVDFVTWPGILSSNNSGNPRVHLQSEPGVWVEAGEIEMETTSHRVRTIDTADLDGDGADEIAVSVAVWDGPGRYALVFWQAPGSLNTAVSFTASCREAHFTFADADGNGLTDMACRGDAGVLLYRQVAGRTFLREFYLHTDNLTSWPVIGDVVGDSRLDLVTAYVDGSYSVRVYEGVSPTELASLTAVLRGTVSASSGTVDGICIEAISAHTGAVLAEAVSTGGSYQLEVPAGIYVLRLRDCRPHPRDPAGMSYLGHMWGSSDPIFLTVTRGSDTTVDLYTDLQRDMTGVLVDDVSGQPLEGIRVWEGIPDGRISGYSWIANSTMTDDRGRFTRYGSYRQIEFFTDDPLGVYPPHSIYIHDDPGDIGTWGLVDPIMRDIRDSIFLRDILWLRDTGVTKGCNPPVDDLFCTTDFVTRGQMAAFLVRFLGLSGSGSASFVDDDDSIFEGNIEVLAHAGITQGCNPPANDRFCPNDFVTRGQMAAFLTRALGLRDTGSVDFVDDNGSVFEDATEALATAGVTKGCNPPANDRFCPNNFVTRGQMAAFLARSSPLR